MPRSSHRTASVSPRAKHVVVDLHARGREDDLDERYTPCTDTLVGEPEPIWDGHAHAGTFEGRLGAVPVYNVSVPVMQRDFFELELRVPERAQLARALTSGVILLD